MKCIYHNNLEAEYICSVCGQPVCRECNTVIAGKNVCRSCGSKNVQYNMPQYSNMPYKKGDGVNGFLFFIFVAVPGLRHMYLGLMNRGLQFLISFFGAFTIGIITGNSLEGIIIPIIFIIWFYSAFDSYQCRKLLARGEKIEDKPIFEEYSIHQLKGFIGARKKMVGIAIILLGVYMLLRQLRWYLGGIIPERIIRILYGAIDFGFGSIIPVLLIIGGIYLMSSVRRKDTVVENTGCDE